MRWSLALALICSFACHASHAEVLFDIRPLDTLGDIKKKFPNASIQSVKAAWVKADQGFYSLEGAGQPGKLMLAFTDSRPQWRSNNLKAVEAAAAASEPSKAQTDWLNFTSEKVNASDDLALTIDWVRWAPSSPIPLQRYKSKYGEPDKCGFSDADMTPFCRWMSRGLLVNLTDDQKSVLNAEADFTKADYREAYLRRYGTIPEFLREDKPQSTTKSQPKSKTSSGK